jgi:hypothetical protein
MGLGNSYNDRAGYNRAETGPDYLTAAQDCKTMSLLEKMLEEQRRIALCLEQLEKKWHVLLLLRCRLEVATLPSQSQW